MSTVIARQSGGRHAASRRREDRRIADLEARLKQSEAARAQAEADNTHLTAENEQLVCDLTQAIIRASQDEMRIAVAEAENRQLKVRVRELGDKVIRAAAEHARLRQAVINARPRITVAPTDLVRPYSPVVELPYVSPAPYRDTSTDDTQHLPILDQPQPWPVYRMRAH